MSLSIPGRRQPGASPLVGDYPAARSLLLQRQGGALRLGTKYAAAQDFVNGVGWLNKNDFSKATELLGSSLRIDQNPETAYFPSKVEMANGDWRAAVDDLNWILANKGKVVIGSVATVIPLAQQELNVCYKRSGIRL